MRKILPVVLVGLLAGCSTPAYRASEIPVPSTYSAGGVTPATTASRVASEEIPASVVRVSTTPASVPFWSELGDSTLTRLVREAQRANTDVRIAQSRLMSARASRRLASFDLVPTITATGSTSRFQSSLAQTPGLTSQLPAVQLWDVGFDASWEVDIFGRVGRTVKAQGALAESSEYGLEDVQVSVAAEVARTYFDLRGAQRQLAVSGRNAANQRKIVKLTEDRLAAGRGTAFDTERAKSVLYLTLATTPGLESQIALDRNRLAVLLGRAPRRCRQRCSTRERYRVFRIPCLSALRTSSFVVAPTFCEPNDSLRHNRYSSGRRKRSICRVSRWGASGLRGDLGRFPVQAG